MKIGYRDLIEAASREIETIPVAAAIDMLDAAAIQFVDVRDRRELEREGRIPGSFHCPRGMLEFWIDPGSPYHKDVFARPKKFLFYCASGWRSALAAKTAQDMGLEPVAHLGGGFSAWRDLGGRVETLT